VKLKTSNGNNDKHLKKINATLVNTNINLPKFAHILGYKLVQNWQNVADIFLA